MQAYRIYIFWHIWKHRLGIDYTNSPELLLNPKSIQLQSSQAPPWTLTQNLLQPDPGLVNFGSLQNLEHDKWKREDQDVLRNADNCLSLMLARRELKTAL